MKDRDRPDLSPEDRIFVRRIAEGYAPPRMPAARRVAFQEALDARLDRLRTPWRPLVGAASAAALALWLAFPATFAPEPLGVASRPGEAEALLTLLDDQPEPEVDLPPDYLAIESLFLNG